MVECDMRDSRLKTFTRTDLIESIHRTTGFSQRTIGHIVDHIFREMRSAFLQKEDIKIPKFGTFSVSVRHARVGHNMHTGQKVLIEPRLHVSLRASQMLKEHIDLSYKKRNARIVSS
jgi:DNA-binding protein HU-beta